MRRQETPPGSALAPLIRGPHRALFYAVALCVTVYATVCAPLAHGQDAASMKTRHAALQNELSNNSFRRPLHLESSQTGGKVQGAVYARLDRPFAAVSAALRRKENWCDILILHLNVKGCRTSTPQAGDTLSLSVGRKFDQPLEDAYRLEFLFDVESATPDYLQVTLNAQEGPVGTSDYAIVLEVAQLDVARSLLNLSYSYSYGMAARLGLQAYLATKGRDKLGFSIVGRSADGQPEYIRGTRGAIERNTMRYYLAIEAYLGALAEPESARLEKRLSDWHTAVERYPLQLHELEREQYLGIKRKEVERQRAPRR